MPTALDRTYQPVTDASAQPSLFRGQNVQQLQLFGTAGDRRAHNHDRPGNLRPLAPHLHRDVRDFLLESSDLYPGIDKWWDRRVVPGLGNGQRVCRVRMVDGKMAAVAIGKRSHRSSKLCTLRVRDEYQGQGIGQQLLHSTLRDLLSTGARRMHLTISEPILDQCGRFFDPYGFSFVTCRKGWYIRGMYELAFSANAHQLRRGLASQPRLFDNHDMLVLSVKPEYAALIEQGKKRVEFRRRFSTRVRSAKALLYVTAPVQEFRLVAQIADVVIGTPLALWERFHQLAGVARETFQQYFAGAKQGFALVFSDVRPLPSPVPLRHPKLAQAGYRPPQSFSFIRSNSPVLDAIGLTTS